MFDWENFMSSGLGGGKEACGPQKMNRKLLGSQILSASRPGGDQPEGSDPEFSNSGTAEKIHPQELRKNLRVPIIRWGEMCAEEDTLAGEIKELHRGREIGRPFGLLFPRSAD